MRTSFCLSLVFSALAVIGCSKNHRGDTTPPPPPPEFESAAAPSSTETPASEGREDQIAPEDQVLFSFDSATLDPASTKVLDDIAAWVSAEPSRTILVKGHADTVGSGQYNLALSDRRAESVASYLYARGVKKEQVAIIAVGEADAVIEPAPSNRRVVIYAITTTAAK